jgi:hypothetical protein
LATGRCAYAHPDAERGTGADFSKRLGKRAPTESGKNLVVIMKDGEVYKKHRQCGSAGQKAQPNAELDVPPNVRYWE